MSSIAAFIQERRYLKNVSPSTVSWYTHASSGCLQNRKRKSLKDTVMRMREKGLKETGCNAAIRAINVYLHWNSGSERKCASPALGSDILGGIQFLLSPAPRGGEPQRAGCFLN